MSDQVPESPKPKPKTGLIHRISSRKGMVILAIVSLLLLLAAVGGVAYYSGNRPLAHTPKEPPSLSELATEFPEISQILQDEKLASVYKEFLEAYQKGGQVAALDLAKKRGILNAKNEIRMTLQLDTTQTGDLQASLEAHGIRVTAVSQNLIDIAIPLAVLEESLASDSPGRIFMDISGLEHIIRLGMLQKSEEHVGSVETEGVPVIGADVWQAAGITGKGVKIGVLDVGFDKYKSLLGGDLPDNVLARSFIADTEVDQTGIEHGSAVAEIIHDVAPDAELVLAAYQTTAEKQIAIDWLMAQGVDIISSSTGTHYGPADGTSINAQMIDQVVAKGVLWINSSGNEGFSHYRAQFTDTNGNGYHEFSAGDEYLGIAPPTGPTKIFLNWDDWKNGTQDFDLYVLDQNGEVVASSTDTQNGPGSDAAELIYYEFPDQGPYYVQVYAVHATRAVTLDLFINDGEMEYYSPEYSLSIPGDARGSLTVGATNWKTGKLEDYSSRGPTDDGRLKPELVAPSGVTSAAYGGTWIGTSASCPHVSGAAALVLQAYPDFTPKQVTDFLLGRAKDMDVLGPDSNTGYGELWLGDPPSLPNVVPGPTPTQPVVAPVPTKSLSKTETSPKPTSTPELEKEPVTTKDEFGWIANLILVGCVILPGFLGVAGIGLLGVIVYRRRSQTRSTSQPYSPMLPVWPAAAAAPAKPAAGAENLCPRCGTLNRPGARFCISCGFEMQIDVPPTVIVPVFCSRCGYELRPEAKFCPNCGQKVE